MALSPDLFASCLPVINSDIARCGGVTSCNISATTSDELESIFKDASGAWRRMNFYLDADFMGKACQVKRNSLYDFIRHTHKSWDTRNLGGEWLGGEYHIRPFVMMGLKNPINDQFWTVTGSADDNGELSPNGFAYDNRWDAASQGSIPASADWFPRGGRVHIRGLTSGGTVTQTQWKIADAVVVGTITRIYLTAQNTTFGAEAGVSIPTMGLLVMGTPNIDDFEEYCAQIPALNTNNIRPFWYETTRYSICDDDQTNDFIAKIIADNPLYKNFLHTPQAEYVKQITANFQNRHVWQFFFGKALANQTLLAWNSLESITVDATSLGIAVEGRCVGRRANAIGLYEQLKECSRVKDLQNDVLNIEELKQYLYDMSRIRQGISSGADRVFELWMPSFMVPMVSRGFLRYFKMVSEDMLRLNMELSSKTQQSKEWEFTWREFELDWPSVRVRLVSHPALDDLSNALVAANANLAPAGRFIWIFDWSTIFQLQIASNSVTNRTGSIGDLAQVNTEYLCRMKVPQKAMKMVSLTYANVLECAAANLWLENVGNGIAEHEGQVGDPVDLYGHYQ